MTIKPKFIGPSNAHSTIQLLFSGEERLNSAIGDLRAVEAEKRECMIEIEKRRCEELESNMAALKQSFLEQQEADKERLESANQALKQLDESNSYQVCGLF